MGSCADERDTKLYPSPRALRDSIEMGEAFAHASLMSRRIEHLLVVANFTERSEYAIGRAVECGNKLEAQVTILHVIEPGPTRSITKRRQYEARESLAKRIQIMPSDARSDISINVRIGEPCLEIAREAIELGSDVIVLGLDGEGQMATDVVRYSDKPILLVTRPPAGPYRCSVVDMSVTPQSTASAAFRLAPTAESHFVLIRSQMAFDSSNEKLPKVRLKQLHSAVSWHSILNSELPWVPVSLVQATGDPIDVLFDVVDQVSADLLVVDADGALQEICEHKRGLVPGLLTAPRCDLLLVGSNDCHSFLARKQFLGS